MQIAIRPMEANLTHDTEFIARMVIFCLYRTPTAKFTLADRSIALLHAIAVEKILIGIRLSTAQLLATPSSKPRFGTMMQSRTI